MGETSVTSSATGDVAGGTESASSTDGRLTRAARTRTAVVDALLTLNARGHLRPTARDIAAEAGVSLRSVYVHFDDLEALFVEASRPPRRAADRRPAAARRRGPLRPSGSTPSSPAESSSTSSPRASAGRRCCRSPFSPVLQQVLANGRQALRAEVGCSFAPELAAVDGDEMPLLRAIDVAGNAMTWESLRTFQHLSVDEATAQVRAMIVAFVRAWAPAAGDADPTAPDDARATTRSTPADDGR